MNLQSLTQHGIDEATASMLLLQINTSIEEQLVSKLSLKEQELKSLYDLDLLAIKLSCFIETQSILASAKNITAVKAIVLENLAILDPDYVKNYSDSKELITSIITDLKASPETKFLFNSNANDKNVTSDSSQKSTFKGFKPLESSNSKATSKLPSYEELSGLSTL